MQVALAALDEVVDLLACSKAAGATQFTSSTLSLPVATAYLPGYDKMVELPASCCTWRRQAKWQVRPPIGRKWAQLCPCIFGHTAVITTVCECHRLPSSDVHIDGRQHYCDAYGGVPFLLDCYTPSDLTTVQMEPPSAADTELPPCFNLGFHLKMQQQQQAEQVVVATKQEVVANKREQEVEQEVEVEKEDDEDEQAEDEPEVTAKPQPDKPNQMEEQQEQQPTLPQLDTWPALPTQQLMKVPSPPKLQLKWPSAPKPQPKKPQPPKQQSTKQDKHQRQGDRTTAAATTAPSKMSASQQRRYNKFKVLRKTELCRNFALGNCTRGKSTYHPCMHVNWPHCHPPSCW